MADPIELWGTFAVADHLREAPFVTDVLLYDRLVIPVPSGDYPWNKVWNAEKLKPSLDTLGDLAVQMPWGETQHSQWQLHTATQAVSDDIRDVQAANPDTPAFHVTRRILCDYANEQLDNALFAKLKAFAKRPGTKVEAVAAYNLPADLVKDLNLQTWKPAAEKPLAPAAVFNWTVHVPAGEDSLELLKQATRLARRRDFCEQTRSK